MWFAGPARRMPAAGRPQALRLGFDLKPGMRVGLFGGSFNPAHDGHAHVAETARVRLGLDKGAARFAKGPSMIVSDAESRIGSVYTIDTLRVLKARFPGVCFVWIMGADSLASFHRWRGWTQIMRETPMAVVSRPHEALRSRFSPAARRFAFARLPSRAASALPCRQPPAWVYLSAPLNFTSSTALRRAQAPGSQNRP
jgi:nicotinate-nucleotide adenylyltransferase